MKKICENIALSMRIKKMITDKDINSINLKFNNLFLITSHKIIHFLHLK